MKKKEYAIHSYFHSIYIVLGIISNLDMIWSIWGGGGQFTDGPEI